MISDEGQRAIIAKLISNGFEPEMAAKMLTTATEVHDGIHNMRTEVLQHVMKVVPNSTMALSITALILHLETADTARLYEEFKEMMRDPAGSD